MTRIKNNGRKSTTDAAKSNSFALFGDDVVVHNNNSDVDLFSKAVKKSKEAGSSEQIGSQHSDEKPELSELNDKVVRYQAKRGFRSIKVNKDNIASESGSADVKGQSNTETDRGSKPFGNKPGKVKPVNNGSVNKAGRRNKEVQKSEGGTGVHENNNSDPKVVDYSKYPVGEFKSTDRIQNYTIKGAPRIIDDFLSEIIIDGYRYTVSSWAIKDGQYIQGLDSKFLISKYKVSKK